jgi:hypothetical protein
VHGLAELLERPEGFRRAYVAEMPDLVRGLHATREVRGYVIVGIGEYRDAEHAATLQISRPHAKKEARPVRPRIGLRVAAACSSLPRTPLPA